MSSASHPNSEFEQLLRQALAPIEPPEDLELRLERTLDNLLEAAADELEGWELSSMRDPRNWLRPVVPIAVGGVAAVGLVILGARQRHARRKPAANALELAETALQDVAEEARRVIDRAKR